MSIGAHPLTEAELDQLDKFLLDRIDEDANDDLDLGVIDVSTLDGLFTAIVSGPQLVPPSQWLPAVWGDCEPVWEDIAEFQDIFALLTRHMNSIADTLLEQPEGFDPLYYYREVEGETYLIVDEWCAGYVLGISLCDSAWFEGGEEVSKLLAPILAFTAATEWRGHEFPDDEAKELQQLVAPSALTIYDYWLARRQSPDPFSQPVRHNEPRVGRNDPCPCGSGKKYKRCCLQ